MVPAADCAVVAPLLVRQQPSSCVDGKVTGGGVVAAVTERRVVDKSEIDVVGY